MNMFGNSLLLMEKSMNYLWKKQDVSSNNISNVSTPGYKSKYVTFEDELKKRLDQTLGKRSAVEQVLNQTTHEVHATDSAGVRLDGNNVQPDIELIEMTRTAMQYQYAMRAYSDDVLRMRTAIKG